MAEALPISGQIDPKTFPFLLMNLHRQGATGSFKVEGPLYQKALYFRNGRILFGSSNDPRDQLGAILIENGKISPEQLEDVNSKVGPGSPLAKVLAETGFVNQRELSEAARTKVERILSDIIAYASGNFEFEDGVLPKGAVDLKLSTERLVLAAVRRIQDRNFVLRHLSGLAVVLIPSFESDEKLEELQGESSGLLANLDGMATLKDAAERSRLEDFEAAKVACALLFLGLVERRESRIEASGFVLDDEGADLDLGETARGAFLVEEDEHAAPPIGSQPEEETSFADILGSSALPGPTPVVRGAAALSQDDRHHPRAVLGLAPEATSTPGPDQEKRQDFAPRGAASIRSVSDESGPSLVSRGPDATSGANHSLASVLDVILDGKNHEGPLEPLERPDLVWSARRDKAPVSNPKPAGGHRALWLSAGGAVVLAALGFAGWFFFLRNPAPQVSASQPAPRPAPSAAATLAPPASIAGPVASAPTSMARAGSSPAAAPSAAPAPAAAPSAPPLPPPTAPPRASATESGGSLEKARRLLQNGGFPEAARTFVTNVKGAPKNTLTVQLFVACSPDTVQKAVAAVNSPELYILPTNYKGQSCFRLCWGLYTQESRATSAMRSLPEYFRKGGATPRVVPASSLIP